MSLTLALTPSGRLLLEDEGEANGVSDAVASRIHAAFADTAGDGLLHLGLEQVATPLPAVLSYFRKLARGYLTSFCATPELEAMRDEVEIEPPLVELDRLLGAAPPMRGGEYLSRETLRSLWRQLDAARKAQLERWDGTVEAFLSRGQGAWHTVGRVHLHLAENKQDAARPFAFLATYTTGLSDRGKPQHRPLGAAVRDSAEAGDRAALLHLLDPVERASQSSALMRELADTRALFSPQRWTIEEAHRFLKEVPALEAAGLLVRVPDWWQKRSRPEVVVRVGGRPPSTLGMAALLDFDLGIALDGEPLSAAELRQIRQNTAGLQLVRGRWVEVDAERLDEILARWKEVQQRAAKHEISFGEAMRLVAGASLDGDPVPEEAQRWSRVIAGDWLREQLARLRAPETIAASAVDAELKTSLRPYQRSGVEWLHLMQGLGLGACLADDMGLGKTIQIIALLLRLQKAGRATHLLVAPASLLANWVAEIARFAPSLRVHVAHPSAGREAVEKPSAASLAELDLVITTYGTAMRVGWLGAHRWDLLIVDEAQAIKNAGAKQTRAIKTLSARSRVALTGTPVENRVGDLWSIFDFLNPGLLGSPKAFGRLTKRLAKRGDYGPLRELCRPYLLRRLKTDRRVIADLPEKIEVRAFSGLTKVQAALYGDTVTELGKKLEALAAQRRRGDAGTGDIARRGAVLAALLRLKQICNHPSQWLGDGAYAPEASGKLARLAELCDRA